MLWDLRNPQKFISPFKSVQENYRFKWSTTNENIFSLSGLFDLLVLSSSDSSSDNFKSVHKFQQESKIEDISFLPDEKNNVCLLSTSNLIYFCFV